MTPATSERDLFLLNLRRSGLVTDAQLRDAAVALSHIRSGSEAAHALVRIGLLTRFQARMLLHGRTMGFFLGPYRILEKIGHGGMGKVYKALHQTMNRVVALKILSPSLVKTPKARALFLREVQTAAQLHHPNIVHAYDANEVDGRYFLAMEYVAGATLSQIVHQRGPMPIGLACEVIRQAALGLQHAHEQGLVHRDIKPANLMVSVVRETDGAKTHPLLVPRVKILDFGLARLHRRTKRKAEDPEVPRNPITGTPDFMSPEQACDKDAVDIRSDLYSLGCTFYYLLTGRVPFPGGSMLDKLIRHHSEMPTAPEVLRPKISPTVAAIGLKLLSKDPADRFQTPQELGDALAPLASCGSLSKARLPRRRVEPKHARTPRLAEKTVGNGLSDTAPHMVLPAQAEQEAIAAWVDSLVVQKQRSQRRWYLAAGAAVAALISAGTAIIGLWSH
jgi:serine/threonine-protein kinase